MAESNFERTPIRKSPRFNHNTVRWDSTPIHCSRPSFDLHAFTPSPVRKVDECIDAKCILFGSSKGKVSENSSNDKCINISSKSLKRKGKEKIVYPADSKSYPLDSDFEDQLPILKRFRLKNDNKSTKEAKSKAGVTVAKKLSIPKDNKSDKLKGKTCNQPSKIDKKTSRWLSYINFNVFDEITIRLSKLNMMHLFKDSPFGYLLNLPRMKVQCQLIRSLVHHETMNDRRDMFYFNLNGTDLRFGLPEFRIVTGFKCGTLDDFIHDLNGPSKLVDTYFPDCGDKGVLKADLIKVFNEEGLIKDEDVFNMCMIYFISTYILSSPPKLSYVPLDHFLLVESGRYTSYPWGHLSFLDLRDSISSQMAEDPNYVRFFGFPLALQVWFYECCNHVDKSIADRNFYRTPRIFNWSISKRKIYYESLKKGMFRKFGNQYKFKNMVFTAEELSAIEVEKLGDSNDPEVHKNEEQFPDRSHRQDVEEFDSSNSSEAFQKLAKEVFLVRKQLSSLEVKVDAQLVEMKTFIDESFKNLLIEIRSQQGGVSKNDNSPAQKDLDNEEVTVLERASLKDELANEFSDTPKVVNVVSDQGQRNDQDFQQFGHNSFFQNAREVSEEVRTVSHKTPTLDDIELPDYRESQIVALETKTTYVTPMQQGRTKVPGKYGHHRNYVGTSEKDPVFFHMKHPFVSSTNFDVDNNLIDSFKKWIKERLSKKRGRKKSAFTIESNQINPPFDFGVDRVDLMDWFYSMVTTGQPWGDSHVDVIMYYLRKKSKYGPGNHTRITFTDPFFIRWIEQIHVAWDKSKKDNRLITPDHEVAQYIKGFKIHANTPWELVDYVCIPINVPEACHWFLAVLSIKSRSIHVFDSLWEVGSNHSAAVSALVSKLAKIIPLFFISTGYYGKRNDIDWKNTKEYKDCAAGDPFDYFIGDNIPQQREGSNDCGLYTCVFAEYFCQGHLDITKASVDPELYRFRYGALLWDYGKRKIESGAISESEVTGKVVSRFGSRPRSLREHVLVSGDVVPSKHAPRRK